MTNCACLDTPVVSVIEMSDHPPDNPVCYICSKEGDQVFHIHNSPKEIRVIQNVEHDERNLSYMCTTCMDVHPAVTDPVLNVVLGTSQIHNIHTPRAAWSAPERMPPDPIHIDWVTVCNASIRELERAWLADYEKETRAMRILLMAGVDDLARGNSRDDIVEAFMHFKLTVDKQNSFHPEKRNELVIPTILNPPQLTWFDDNGIAPPNHQNMLADLKELNSWIIYYNRQNGKEITPRFHRFGVKDGWGKDDRGRRVKVKKHLFAHWKQDRFHLHDKIRVKLGTAITRHFLREQSRQVN